MAFESNKGNKPYTNEEIKGIGNVVQDPKRISASSKMNVTVLRVAANSMALDRDGNEIERTHFRDLKLFGMDADRVLASVTKGTRVKYEGRLSPKEGYENRAGDFIEEDEILVSRDGLTIVPSDGKKSEGGARRRSADEDEAPRSRGRGRSRGRDAEPEDDFDDEDIDDTDDEDLDDDLDLEDDAPKRRSRSAGRSRGRSRAKKDVEADDELAEYAQDVI